MGQGQGRVPCSVDELRTLFLFERLTDAQLEWLCDHGGVQDLPAGMVCAEGEPADFLYVLLDGEMVLSQRVGPDDVELTRSSSRGVYAGAFLAYLGDRVPQTYTHTLRVPVASQCFVLAAGDFAELMREWFPMPVHLLDGLFFGSRNSAQTVGQRERLLALGQLSAGLTHELNNPASAAKRASSGLRERVVGMRGALEELAADPNRDAVLAALVGLRDVSGLAVPEEGRPISPMEAADREDAVADWLAGHGVADSWDLAPPLVRAGWDDARLKQAVGSLGDSGLGVALRWLGHTTEAEQLLDEIEDAVTRISTLVDAAKHYTQRDRDPYHDVDVHLLLDSTLAMLGGKIGPDVDVVKDYDPALPRIPAHAAELNQVWTNLIDNALYAMERHGTLTVRTRADDGHVLVEIGDTGSGVPAEIGGRIFEPFFTSKPVGEGTGLGLDISWDIVVRRHHGDLGFVSVPGDTTFRVRLPLTAAAPTA